MEEARQILKDPVENRCRIGGPDAVGRGQDVTEVEERGKRGREGGREGGGSYSDVKSGGGPSPRLYPKGQDRLHWRRISRQRLYQDKVQQQPPHIMSLMPQDSFSPCSARAYFRPRLWYVRNVIFRAERCGVVFSTC